MSQTIIRADGLSKTYVRYRKAEGKLFRRQREAIKALADVSFETASGEAVGLLGPNGAGKSTMVKLLCGILTPTRGGCTVNGFVPWKERREYTHTIGAVFGQRTQLWWDVPIRDSYLLLRDIYALPEETYRARLEEVSEALELGRLMDTPLRQLSLGQRMRAELCGSLLHSPRLLFLDEPTIGLDAVSKLRLREFLVRENAERGTSLLLTTHDMADIQALCSRVLVLGHGHILYDGAFDALLARYRRTSAVRCVFAQEPDLKSLPGWVTRRHDDDGWQFSWPAERAQLAALMPLLTAAAPLNAFSVIEPAVDEMIAEMYRELHL